MASNIQSPGPESQLIEHLRSFLNLTTHAPLEYVCNSALYLLNHVPSTRHAVLEYIGTFYKVATILHLRYNLNQKNQNNVDLTAETNNINHINQVIDLIENSFADLLSRKTTSELWSTELSQWLIDLIGDIVTNTGTAFADTPGLSNEEINMFKSPTLVDGLDIWSNQCKPTQSLLLLIQKCFTHEDQQTKLNIVESLLSSNTKYSSKIDWVLCYFSALDPDLIFERILAYSLKEFTSSNMQQQKLSLISVVNFYALNFSNMVKAKIKTLISDESDEKLKLKKSMLIYLLRASSQSAALLNLLLDDMLNKKDNFVIDDELDDKLLNYLLSYLINSNDPLVISNLFSCLKQINNSVAIFDLISSVLDWFTSQSEPSTKHNMVNTAQNIINAFLDELISCTYLGNPDAENLANEENKAETTPFLKTISSINKISFKLLVNQLMSILKANTEVKHLDKELIYKLLVIFSINGSDYMCNLVMSELILTSSKHFHANTHEDSMLIKLRQEINPFHPQCLIECIKSIVSLLGIEKDENKLFNLIENLKSIYEWDLQNPNYMSQTMSSILIGRECFVGIINQLDVKTAQHCSLLIIELYNKVLKSEEQDLGFLKLNVSDLIVAADKLISHFYTISLSINEENVNERGKEIIELIKLIKNTLTHLSYLNEEACPYKNMLLRTIVDKLFELSINVSRSLKHKLEKEIDFEEDYFDENSNLFKTNMNFINNELTTHKSNLKTLKSSLADLPSHRTPVRLINKYKNLLNFAIIDMLEILCSKFTNEKETTQVNENEAQILKLKKEIISEQMCNLAELLVQHVLLEQHFIDYQWASPNGNESDDSFESEVEAMKLYIERDVAVQKKFENPNNDQILWLILEFLASDEQSFYKASPLIRSLLASLIIQWDSFQEQLTRNTPKTLGITIRLLNIINRANLLPKPLCFIVDIIPFLNSFETHIGLTLIWKNLRTKIHQAVQIAAPNNQLMMNESKKNETVHLRYIFQKNIGKLAHLYPKFFQAN